MFRARMFDSSSYDRDFAISFGPNHGQEIGSFTNTLTRPISVSSEQPSKKNQKKRNLPGNPECVLNPNAEVVALSPTSLLAKNRFFCDICHKGFTREQNLQLHRKGHNLPGNLKQRTNGKEMKKKKVYVCPEPTCIYHNPSRAMVDLTGIKRHFVRKHYNGEKIYKCDKCSKRYAVKDDWKAHCKQCGSRKENAGNHAILSGKETLATNKVQCNNVAAENAKISTPINPNANQVQSNFHFNSTPTPPPPPPSFYTYPSSKAYFPGTWELLPLNPNPDPQIYMNMNMNNYNDPHINTPMMISPFENSQYVPTTTLPSILLQNVTTGQSGSIMSNTLDMYPTPNWQRNSGLLTRDLFGLTNQYTGGNFEHGEGSGSGSANNSKQVDYQARDRDHAVFNHQQYDDQSTSPTNCENYWL